jgi:hypothetical protein
MAHDLVDKGAKKSGSRNSAISVLNQTALQEAPFKICSANVSIVPRKRGEGTTNVPEAIALLCQSDVPLEIHCYLELIIQEDAFIDNPASDKCGATGHKAPVKYEHRPREKVFPFVLDDLSIRVYENTIAKKDVYVEITAEIHSNLRKGARMIELVSVEPAQNITSSHPEAFVNCHGLSFIGLYQDSCLDTA